VQAAQTALAGGYYVMIAHGIITGALFLLVGVIYDRTHTRDLTAFGGLAAQMPGYSGIFRLAMFASLGLPGLAGFIGEFMVFVGAYPIFPVHTVIAAVGLIVTAAFLLWTVQRVLLGPLNPRWTGLPDMDRREWAVLAPLGLFMVVFGVWPRPILNALDPATAQITRHLRTATELPPAPPEGPEAGVDGSSTSTSKSMSKSMSMSMSTSRTDLTRTHTHTLTRPLPDRPLSSPGAPPIQPPEAQ
jgi:NADH:ubiquinone oxidoreductase subunit 4 (subunit M)